MTNRLATRTLLCAAAVVLATGMLYGHHSVAAPASTDASVHGKAVFARCAICHDVQSGVTRIGPTLSGVVGRCAGSVPGYS